MVVHCQGVRLVLHATDLGLLTPRGNNLDEKLVFIWRRNKPGGLDYWLTNFSDDESVLSGHDVKVRDGWKEEEFEL